LDKNGAPARTPAEQVEDIAQRAAEALAAELNQAKIPAHFFLAIYPPKMDPRLGLTYRTITPRAFIPRMLKFLWTMVKREENNAKKGRAASPLAAVKGLQ
jgi:hypothetical protein